jgi:quercetin dioxygenase-like cupin family protein
VLSGTVTLTLEGKLYLFREGDSAHYDSTDAHHWHDSGERNALLI